MSLIVQKYGGTSVGDAERIKNVARRVGESRAQGNRIVVVVSAMGGVTDGLIRLAKQIMETPPEREMDVLLATGEQESIALLAMAIHDLGDQAISFTGAQLGIVTDSTHRKARIREALLVGALQRSRESLRSTAICVQQLLVEMQRAGEALEDFGGSALESPAPQFQFGHANAPSRSRF